MPLAKARSEDATPRGGRVEFFDQAIEVLRKRLLDSRVFAYNHQLNWSLQEVPANSLEEALQVVREFLEFAHYAGGEFDWDFSGGMKVRRHAWKHTRFQHIKDSFEALEWLPQLLLEHMRPHPERLFVKAARRDPAAVARVNHLFHSSRKRMLEAAGVLFNDETAQEIVGQIPTVAELAAELANEASRDPDSEEAEAARSKLRILTSKAAAKGAGGRSGRTAVQYDKDTIKHVFEISCALHKQLIEVNKFLGPFLESREEHSRELSKHFPDLSQLLGGGLIDLTDQQTTHGAYRITAAALGISPSKVEKSVYD